MHQTNAIQQRLNPFALFCLGTIQAKGHVFRDAQMGKQGKVLKHQPDRALFRQYVVVVVADQRPIQINLAFVLRVDPCDHAQGRGFTAAGRPQKTGDMTGQNGQRHVIDDGFAFKPTRQIADFKTGFGGAHV